MKRVIKQMKKALEGIRVLDLTRVLAGPYCTMVLGDLGAEIIKIDIPGGGDDSRAFGPFINGESAYFMSLNRNKKSLTLNLKSREGKHILRELIKISDVLVENYRPGAMERLGFTEDTILELNPEMIYAACSGFGHTGPDKYKPCYDGIAQARSGMMSITGPDKDHPTRVGSSIADIVAGLFTAIGILSSLYSVQKGEPGQKVDVAMLDSQVAILENALARYTVTGEIPQPLGNRHPSIVPFESFETADDKIMIAAGNDDLWTKLCKAVGREELADDPRFTTNQLRSENYDKMRAILAETLKTKTTRDWMELIEEEGIPCSPINNIAQVMNDEQIKAREMITEIGHPEVGIMKVANTPIKLSRTPGSIESPAPLLGEDTEELLTEYLEYSREEIDRLKDKGVI